MAMGNRNKGKAEAHGPSDRLPMTIRPWAMLAIPLALSACAVGAPPSIVASDGSLSERSVQLAPLEDNRGQRAEFAAAIERALGAHSVQLAHDAPLIAEFAIAERSATAGEADPEASSNETIVWTSEPRDHEFLDQCDARRLRATLVLIDGRDGSLAYRGVAEATDCEFDSAYLDQMATALVGDALGL